MKCLIKELGQVITGNTPSKREPSFYDSDDIGFIKPDSISNSEITDIDRADEYISENARKMARIASTGDVLVTCIGSIGKIGIVKGSECAFNQQINAIRPNKNIDSEYLAYCLLYHKNQLVDIANAPVVPIINKTRFENFEIQIADDAEQQRAQLYKLKKIHSIISKRKQQLAELDTLIKARFVEMFGDPETNPLRLNTLPMTKICDIIDGDRGKNYPTQEEFSESGYCLFLNAKNVTSNGFSFENCMFITREKDEILRKGHLKRGDVVLTTRGTIGNIAFYDDSVPFENVRINSGMVILRMNHTLVSERFFIEQFKMRLTSIKSKIANGSAQPQLPISTMNKIVMLVPPIEKQNRFVDFVAQVDKSKTVVQQALDEAQVLFDSLMQKYFG